MFISLFFFSFFVAAAFVSPSSPSSATFTIASPQPTATVAAVATATAATERVISRDVDEVEVIPKRRRGRSIPPPPITAAGASRRGWEGSDSMGGKDGAQCTLRVGCLQPSTTTWPEPAAGAVVDVCTGYRGWKIV